MSFESIREHIAAGWAIWLGTLVFSYVLSLVIPIVLKSLGRDPEIKQEHRKRFHLAATIVFFIIITIGQHFEHKFEEIKTGPYKGRLNAGVLSVWLLSENDVIAVTNSIASTNRTFAMGGIGNLGISLPEKGVDAIVTMRILNSGPPSAIWSWKVFVAEPGGPWQQVPIPSVSISATVQTVIGSVQIDKDSNLIQLLSETPLASGAAKIGWLPFHVNGLRKLKQGMKLLITFEDIFGREVRVEHVWEVGK